jgi:hypothetical protein
MHEVTPDADYVQRVEESAGNGDGHEQTREAITPTPPP